MEGLTEGRIVHFVLGTYDVTNESNDPNNSEAKITKTICRPAIIVNAWGGKLEEGRVNLQVFLDGTNDYSDYSLIGIGVGSSFNTAATLWKTSVSYSETKEVETWHWPERN